MKAGVFFVLYLAVILEILIIIVDRDEAEESLKEKIEILSKYIATPPSLERRLYEVEVGVQRTTGIVINSVRTPIDLRISGIKGGMKNLVDVLLRDAKFLETPTNISVDQMQVLASAGRFRPIPFDSCPRVQKRGSKSVGQQYVEVQFELDPQGKQSGVYELWFEVISSQIGMVPPDSENPDSVRFDQLSFPYSVIEDIAKSVYGVREANPATIKSLFNSSSGRIWVALVDTFRGPDLDQLKIDFADLPAEWAAGNEMKAHFRVEGCDPRRVVAINIEPAQFGPVGFNQDKSSWWWRVTPSFQHAGVDSTVRVSVSGNDNRGDPTRSFSPPRSHAFKLVLPTLSYPKSIPRQVCQGEPFKMNLQINGLGEAKRYKVICKVGGVPVDSTVGDARYQSPPQVIKSKIREGDEIEIAAYYDNNPVHFYDLSDGVIKPLVIRRSVIRPKPNIDFEYPPGNIVAIKGGLKFYAYQGCTYTHAKPFSGLPDVRANSPRGDVTGSLRPEVVPGIGQFEYFVIFNGPLPPPLYRRLSIFVDFGGIHSAISDEIILQ